MDLLNEEHFRELLKQWRKVEDNIKDKLNEVESTEALKVAGELFWWKKCLLFAWTWLEFFIITMVQEKLRFGWFGKQRSFLLCILLFFLNFSKLMWTIHMSMTSTFQCECCQCFTFKRCDKFKLKCTSHGGMYSAHYFGKISITSKQWML